MKKWLWIGGLIFFINPSTLAAQSLDLGGVANFVGDLAKQAKGGTLATLGGAVGGDLYIAPYTLHDGKGIKYIEAQAGGKILFGGRASPLVGLGFNISAISNRIWSFQWAQNHITRIPLPDVWIGPYVDLSFPVKNWTFKNHFGGAVSIPL